MAGITFANPGFFYLLIVLIPMIVWYVLRQKNAHASIQVSTVQGIEKAPKTYKHILQHVLFALRCLAITAIIFMLARPQSTDRWQNKNIEGIDIILALDISSSMLAEDFKPNRLGASKDLAIEFISGRPDDRIGLVVFSGESFTQCPITTDHAVVINLFKDIQSGMIEDGTAIGMGLANAVSRLKDSNTKSKVVILLTDGVNNMGDVDPLTAAEIAQTFSVRVYTIGVGSMGEAPYPFKDAWGRTIYQNVPVEIDEDVLQQIAQMTGGQYFRATNNDKLRQIYEQIDQLEKTKIDVKEYSKKQEEYLKFAFAAILLLLIELLLKLTVLRNIP